MLCCQGSWVEALPLLTHAIKSRQDFIAAYAERGLLYGLNEQYAEAMRDLAYAIHVEPGFHRTWAYRAALHVQRSLWGDVIEDATKAIERAPTYAPAYKLRGIGYQVTKRLDLAVADLHAYLEHYPLAPDRAQIRDSIAKLEAPPTEEEPPKGKSWLDRLLGRK
nr:hypothetical protein [Oscillochloris trichoides]